MKDSLYSTDEDLGQSVAMLITFGKVQRVAATRVQRLANGRVQRTAAWLLSCFMAVLIVENHLSPVSVDFANCSTENPQQLPRVKTVPVDSSPVPEEPATIPSDTTTEYEPPLTTPPPIVLPNNVTIALDLAGRVTSYSQSVLSNLTTYPWDDDPICAHFEVKFAKENTFPRFPLTSFPGSGVTWFRQMIEGLTGYYTSSVYFHEKPIIYKSHYGRYMDGRCKCTILEKNHEAAVAVSLDHYFTLIKDNGFNNTIASNQHRGLLLLRNPIDAAIAYRNFISGGLTDLAHASYFKGDKWEKHTEFVAVAWADHATRWIDGIVNGTVIFYENLLHHTETELRRITPFFFPEPINAGRLACVVRHKNRADRKRINRTKIVLTATQRKRFEDAIDKVQTSLRRRNWPLLPLHHYDFHD